MPDQIFSVVRDPVARMASEHRYQRHARRGRWASKALAMLPISIWLRLMLAVAERHPYAFDNHFRPQTDFVPEGARLFRLEDGLGPVTRWLAEVTGEMIEDAVMPHALPKGKGAGVSKADQALIVRVFIEDYARFGYGLPEARAGGFGLAVWIAPVIAFLDRRGRF